MIKGAGVWMKTSAPLLYIEKCNFCLLFYIEKCNFAIRFYIEKCKKLCYTEKSVHI